MHVLLTIYEENWDKSSLLPTIEWVGTEVQVRKSWNRFQKVVLLIPCKFFFSSHTKIIFFWKAFWMFKFAAIYLGYIFEKNCFWYTTSQWKIWVIRLTFCRMGISWYSCTFKKFLKNLVKKPNFWSMKTHKAIWGRGIPVGSLRTTFRGDYQTVANSSPCNSIRR